MFNKAQFKEYLKSLGIPYTEQLYLDYYEAPAVVGKQAFLSDLEKQAASNKGGEQKELTLNNQNTNKMEEEDYTFDQLSKIAEAGPMFEEALRMIQKNEKGGEEEGLTKSSLTSMGLNLGLAGIQESINKGARGSRLDAIRKIKGAERPTKISPSMMSESLDQEAQYNALRDSYLSTQDVITSMGGSAGQQSANIQSLLAKRILGETELAGQKAGFVGDIRRGNIESMNRAEALNAAAENEFKMFEAETQGQKGIMKANILGEEAMNTMTNLQSAGASINEMLLAQVLQKNAPGPVKVQ
jgi:hypothetical protein